MNPLTLEWIGKAEGDLVSARRELRARKAPNYDAACFHAQQCAEKLLKAVLQEAAIPFGKTHNLIALLQLALPVMPRLETLRPHLEFLTAFSVQFRYPGDSADRAVAKAALKHCQSARTQLREELGVEDTKKA